jgi:peptide/nickel transport system substrate-binding protein
MERDDHKRADLYAEAQRIVWDDAPWIFLWVPSLPIVHSARLKGIGSLPNEHFFAAYAEPA